MVARQRRIRDDVIPGHAKHEPGISRFPDAQWRICGLRFAHPGMTDIE
jgi:hypothetical protein